MLYRKWRNYLIIFFVIAVRYRYQHAIYDPCNVILLQTTFVLTIVDNRILHRSSDMRLQIQSMWEVITQWTMIMDV